MVSKRSLCGSVPCLGVLLLLAGCGQQAAPKQDKPPEDPILAAALEQPVLIDPDLVSQNRANNVAWVADGDGMIPTADAGQDAAARARSAAIALVGGPSAMKSPPPAEKSAPLLMHGVRRNLVDWASVAAGAADGCVDNLTLSASWAARLPKVFPIYPQGAAHEAAGVSDTGCSLRVASFYTSVDVMDVLSFYFTRANAAGFGARHTAGPDGEMLQGLRGSASYLVYARSAYAGLTEVVLVTRGGDGVS